MLYLYLNTIYLPLEVTNGDKIYMKGSIQGEMCLDIYTLEGVLQESPKATAHKNMVALVKHWEAT